ncbi:hypothetical protein EBBID32_42560 [Sphingobium indicum BiD32]|uniref:Transposase n=1 Tax=Sphingobium indicum BiD32 TaxID=1301087 RepID=N1MSC7_9SPHN|nr:hypothetical protein EBBID32_42560 [Sphingobium indicum BiD32]
MTAELTHGLLLAERTREPNKHDAAIALGSRSINMEMRRPRQGATLGRTALRPTIRLKKA